MSEDFPAKRLRELVDQAKSLQAQATQLVVDLTDQLQRSIWLHNDTADDRPERRQRERRRSIRP